MNENEILQLILTKLLSLEHEISEVKTTLQQEISDVKTTLQQEISDVKITLQQEISDVKITLQQEISDVKDTLNDTRERVILMESEHGRLLGALGDGYNLLYDKLEPIPEAVKLLQDDVSVIKAVVTNHSDEIHLLKMAK